MRLRAGPGIVLVVLALGLTHGTGAWARDLNGKLGVGVRQTLNGPAGDAVTGFAADYWTGFLQVGFIASVDVVAPQARASRTALGLALHVLYAVARTPYANLMVGGRFGTALREGGQSRTRALYFAEVPLEVEAYLGDHFAVLGHVGLTVAWAPQADAPLWPAGAGSGVALVLGGAFGGGVGFEYYF